VAGHGVRQPDEGAAPWSGSLRGAFVIQDRTAVAADGDRDLAAWLRRALRLAVAPHWRGPRAAAVTSIESASSSRR